MEMIRETMSSHEKNEVLGLSCIAEVDERQMVLQGGISFTALV